MKQLFFILSFWSVSLTLQAQVVINEVMVKPNGSQGLIVFNGASGNEYIELYNPSCQPINVAGYFIGCRQDVLNTPTGGAFRIPNVPAATIAPNSHLVIGTSTSSSDAASIDIKIPDYTSNYCLNDATRNFLLSNIDGWVALYNAAGTPIDAVYWASNSGNISQAADFGQTPCVPTGSPAGVTLKSATQINTTFPGMLKYAGSNPATGLTISRIPDGGTWNNGINPSVNHVTLGVTANCNGGTCNVLATPAAAIAGNLALTCAANSTVLTASPATGVTYQWSATANNATTQTVTVNAAGSYTVTVTNGSGCSSTSAVTVTQSGTLPTVTLTTTPASTTELTCTRTSISLTASSAAGNTFAWSPPLSGTNAVQTITAAGTYTVTVTNPSNSCTNTASMAFTTNTAQPTVTLTKDNDLNCSVTSVTLAATPATGATYAWSAGATAVAGTNTATVATGGNYTVTVTSTANGCASTKSIAVTQNSTSLGVTLTKDNDLNCTVTSVTLTATPATGATYSWSAGATVVAGTNRATVTTGGIYTVTVTNTANGCTGTNSITVAQNTTQPVVALSKNNDLTCAITSVTLAATPATGATYAWSTGATAVAGTNTATVATGGNYTVTVTNTANGCASTNSIAVAQNTTPPVVTLGKNHDLDCTPINASVILTATPATGVTYSWSAGATAAVGTNTATVTTGGNYTVTVTNPANGCVGTNSINVSQNTTQPVVTLGKNHDLDCTAANSSVILTATPATGATYTWSAGATAAVGTNTATVTVGGNYTVTVTNTANGCASTNSITVAQNTTPPVVALSKNNDLTCTTTSVTLAATPATGATYAWSAGATAVIGTNTATVTTGGDYTVTVTNTANGCIGTNSINVSQNTTPLVVTLSKNHDLDCTAANTSVTLTASPATGATYSWSSGATVVAGTNTATVTTGGDYTVTVTNTANGCIGTSSINVAQNTTPPVVTLSKNNDLTCTTTSVTLTASPATGATYAWSAGATAVIGTNTATITTGGNYTVTVTDAANGCTGTNSIAVAQNTTLPTVTIPAPPQLTCAVTCVTLTPTVNPANSTVVWSTGATTNAITACAPSAYSVTVTDISNGCSATQSVTVTSDGNIPNLTITTNPTNTTTLTCSRTSITLTAVANGSGNTLTWDASFATPNSATQVVSAAGTYSVTVTNVATGCSVNTSITITQNTAQPTIAIPQPAQLTCATNCVAINTNFSPLVSTLIWSNGLNTNAITVCTAGDYTVTVTDISNDCSATASTTVTASNDFPTVTLTTLPVATELTCTQASIDITAGFDATISTIVWAAPLNGSNPTHTITAPGVYSVRVTNTTSGCTASASITITTNKTAPTATLTTSNPFSCTQTSSVLTAGGGVSYDFGSGFSVANSLTVTAAGSYTVTVEGANGCTATASTRLAAPAVLVVPAQPSLTVCEETNIERSLTLTKTYSSYLWSTSETTATIKVNREGIYTVIVTDANGCTAIGSVQVVESCSPEIHVPTAFTPNADGLNDVLQVFGVNIKTLEMTIYNRWGQVVFYTNDRTKLWDGTYNTVNAPAGTYAWVITYGSLMGDRLINNTVQGTVLLIREEK